MEATKRVRPHEIMTLLLSLLDFKFYFDYSIENTILNLREVKSHTHVFHCSGYEKAVATTHVLTQ